MMTTHDIAEQINTVELRQLSEGSRLASISDAASSRLQSWMIDFNTPVTCP